MLSLLLLLACGEKEAPSDDTAVTADDSAADDSAADDSAADDSAADDSGADTSVPEGNLSDTVLHALYDPAACRGGFIGPFSGPEWTTTRLTPNAWPYSVERIAYELGDNDQGCKSAVAHAVILFKGPAATPADNPTVLQRYDMPAGISASGRVVRQLLSEPILLSEGEHLFVGVQMSLDGEESTCIATCPLASGSPREDRAWQATGEGPFTWRTVAEAGNELVFDIEAEGAGQ